MFSVNKLPVFVSPRTVLVWKTVCPLSQNGVSFSHMHYLYVSALTYFFIVFTWRPNVLNCYVGVLSFIGSTVLFDQATNPIKDNILFYCSLNVFPIDVEKDKDLTHTSAGAKCICLALSFFL